MYWKGEGSRSQELGVAPLSFSLILTGQISCYLSGVFPVSFQRLGRYSSHTGVGGRKLRISHSFVHVTFPFHPVVLDVVTLVLFVAE